MTNPSLTDSLTHRLDTEDLLVHQPGLQSLAARLVGADQADDLLQDTWVRALEKPPSAQQPLGPWLVRVLSNLAVSSYRSRSRRRDREHAMHESGQDSARLPSPDEIGAELEAAEKVMRAVSELDELPRTIISLRYLRGMPSGQIGDSLELPASTVRWHIQNAVAKMRVSLGKEGRHLSGGWVASIVPLLRMGDGSAAAKLGARVGAQAAAKVGATTMFGPVLLASVLAAFIGIVANLVIGQATLEPVPTTLAATASPGAGPVAKHPQGRQTEAQLLQAITTADTSRKAAATKASLTDTVAEGPALSDPHSRTVQSQPTPDLETEAGRVKVQICCRIVGENQSSLSGAEAALASAGSGFSVADSDGWLELSAEGTPAALGLANGLEVSAPGHATLHLSWPLWVGMDIALGDLELTSSRPLRGFVRDSSGDAIAGAFVTANVIGSPLRSPASRSDELGGFRLPEVARKNATVTVRANGFQPASIRLKDDFEGQVKLRLERETVAPTLAVQIQDPSGLPVPNAVVTLRRVEHAQMTFVADWNGDLRVPLTRHLTGSFTGPTSGDVTASDPALRFAPARRVALPLDGQRRILRLKEGRLQRFIVRNPAGPEITAFRWFQPESIHHPSPIIRCGEVTGSNELMIAIALDHAANQSSQGLMVLADGFAPVSVEFRNLAASRRPIELLLSPEVLAEVHVIQDGTPVKNATVTLTPTGNGPPGFSSTGQAPLAKDVMHGMERTYRTDARGAFSIPQHHFQPFTLRVTAPGLAPWFHHHPGSGTPVALRCAELKTGGTLVGRAPTVQVRAGEPISLTQPYLEATHEGGRVREAEIGASPFFQMHGLAPGRWTLRWLEHGAPAGSDETKDTSRAVDIAAGRVTYIES